MEQLLATYQEIQHFPMCNGGSNVRALQRAPPAVLCMHPASEGQVQDEQLTRLRAAGSSSPVRKVNTTRR